MLGVAIRFASWNGQSLARPRSEGVAASEAEPTHSAGSEQAWLPLT